MCVQWLKRGWWTAILLLWCMTLVIACSPLDEAGLPGGVPSASRVEPGFQGRIQDLVVVGDVGDPSEHLPPGTSWDAQNARLVVWGANVELSGVLVRGSVDFEGSGSMTIRDSVVQAGRGSFVVVGRTPGSVVRVLNSTLSWEGGGPPPTGGAVQVLADITVIAEHNDISGTGDGIQLTGDASTVVGNRIHDLDTSVGAHNDGVQIYSGQDILIEHNEITVPTGPTGNAGVFVQPADDALVTGLGIRYNTFHGGGYGLVLEGDASQVRSVTVESNEWGGDHRWGPVSVTDAGSVRRWSSNVTVDGHRLDAPR
jgi:hypothetical protein